MHDQTLHFLDHSTRQNPRVVQHLPHAGPRGESCAVARAGPGGGVPETLE